MTKDEAKTEMLRTTQSFNLVVAFDAGYAAGERPWHRIENGLPEDGSYLVTAQLDANPPFIVQLDYDSDDEFWSYEDFHNGIWATIHRRWKILAWQELPPPYIERTRRGRRPVKPLFDGPIPDNPEYRRLVIGILKDKRRRDLIERYRNS